jgi:hypothetical protein
LYPPNRDAGLILSGQLKDYLVAML